MITDKPLADALRTLANSHQYLDAPTIDGMPHKYIPCCVCDMILAVPFRVVSRVCDICAQKDVSTDDGPDRTDPGYWQDNY